MSLNTIIRKKSDFEGLLGDSYQAKYLLSYLDEIGANTCIIEKEYVDKDYLVDFQIYYSRCFQTFDRFTTRFHFFKNDIDAKQFEKLMETGDKKQIKKTLTPYLGFIITKPVKNSLGKIVIGRTLLATYAEKDGKKSRHFLGSVYDVSLFGVSLKIKTVPFQMQDRRVSACATIALWTSFHSVSNSFNIPKYSPGEITQISTSYPSRFRIFPQSGLILAQMLSCIRDMDLDVDAIILDQKPFFVPIAVKSYLSAKIPLIANLRLEKEGKTGLHAAVITGYKTDENGHVIELYVHDDGIGPFSRVKPIKMNFTKWDNEWKDRGYTVTLEKLLVPIYHKIRLSFTRIIYDHLTKIEKMVSSEWKDIGELELFLNRIQDYKEFLIKENFTALIDGKDISKTSTLTKVFPRFIWIERSYKNGKKYEDLVFDGTASYPKQFAIIKYI